MTGPVAATLALSAAVLVPVSPRSRIDRHAGRVGEPGQPRRGFWWRVGTGCGIGCVAAAVVAGLPAATGLAAAVLGATVALRRHRAVNRRRGAEEARALEAALEVLVGELRIGAHPVRAFEVAAAESGQAVVAASLRAVAARARLGADVAAGLRSAADSSSLPRHWSRLAIHWQLSCDHGLAISTLMHAAQRDIAERQLFSSKVHADMAGARTSVLVLAALPALGVLLGQLIGAQPVHFLVSDRGSGLLAVGVGLVCAGLLWSDRITGRLT